MSFKGYWINKEARLGHVDPRFIWVTVLWSTSRPYNLRMIKGRKGWMVIGVVFGSQTNAWFHYRCSKPIYFLLIVATDSRLFNLH